MEQVFTNIYENNIWGYENNNTYYKGSSGSGSYVEYNRHTYIPFLKKFIIDNNIKTVVDLGCGDFKCGKLIYDDLDVTYTGYDTYKKIIDHHSNTYTNPKYSFIHLDFCNNKESIISGDMCILKDVIQHWSLENIYRFLDYLIETKKCKYILICNCCNQTKDNTDISNGEWRPLSAGFFPLKKYTPNKLYNYDTKEVSVIEVNTMIPKVIYMCHKYLDDMSKYSQNWKKLNPEYDIKLYDDEMCKTFLLNEYSQLHLDIFNFLEDGPIKADFWRVCIINKYGGLYVDADIEPLVPLNTYIELDDDFVTCISQNFIQDKLSFQFNPQFIMSYKNNVLLQNCIDRYIKQYNDKVPYSYWEYSICNLFHIEGVSLKQSHVSYINGKKFKFMYETEAFNDCEYNGVVVLKNRYDNYINHNFTK
jgi:hypothetical protein